MMYRLLTFGILFCCCNPGAEGQESSGGVMNQDPSASVESQEPLTVEAVESHLFYERTADLPEIRKNGALRVALPYSQTNFFFEKDEFRGFEFELFRELEKHLNKSRQRGEPVLTVIFQLTPVANLINAVNEGKADIAAGIVITEERERSVAFTQPYLSGINTVVVSNNSTPAISSVKELSGKSVLVTLSEAKGLH